MNQVWIKLQILVNHPLNITSEWNAKKVSAWAHHYTHPHTGHTMVVSPRNAMINAINKPSKGVSGGPTTVPLRWVRSLWSRISTLMVHFWACVTFKQGYHHLYIYSPTTYGAYHFKNNNSILFASAHFFTSDNFSELSLYSSNVHRRHFFPGTRLLQRSRDWLASSSLRSTRSCRNSEGNSSLTQWYRLWPSAHFGLRATS